MRVGYVGARQRKIITKIIFCVVPSCNNQLRILINGAKSITWVKELKYLELYFVSSKKFTIDVSVAIKRFYASENAIFCHTKHVSEYVRLDLIELFALRTMLAYSALRLLTYPSIAQMRHLNVCWNNV